MSTATAPADIGRIYSWTRILEGIRQANDDENKDGSPKIGDREAAIRLHISERKVREYRVEGMTCWDADYVCCKGLGLLPWIVYGDVWFAEVEAEESMTELAS